MVAASLDVTATTAKAKVLGDGFAPGKVILLGEHAVVYGHPAVAAGLTRGVRMRLVEDPEGPRLWAHSWGVALPLTDAPGGTPLGLALERVRQAVAPQLRAFCLEASDELPLGAGLGSSAALTAAAARALAHATGVTLSAERLTQVIQQAEQVFHGNPSGVDQATVVRGGLLRFQRPPGGTPNVEAIVPARPVPLVVALLRPHVGTKEAVEALRQRRERHRRSFDVMLGELGALAQDAVGDIQQGNLVALGERFDLAHALLAGLGVSSEDLEFLTHFGRRHGALGAKLTGAGVGGAVVMVTDGDPQRSKALVDALVGEGAQAFSCAVG